MTPCWPRTTPFLKASRVRHTQPQAVHQASCGIGQKPTDGASPSAASPEAMSSPPQKNPPAPKKPSSGARVAATAPACTTVNSERRCLVTTAACHCIKQLCVTDMKGCGQAIQQLRDGNVKSPEARHVSVVGGACGRLMCTVIHAKR
jgi:hypothetical protein